MLAARCGARGPASGREASAATTSALAAAVWFPTHVGPWERVLSWGEDTFRVLSDQAATQVPGVVMRESLGLYRRPPAEPAWAAAVGGVRPAEADELPPGYRHGLRFAVPLREMPVYLPWLVARVPELGGRFVQRHVRSLDELGENADVVVNCAGLGALELDRRPAVHPVRGQIVRVSNPGLTMSVRDEEHPGGRAYVHPRRRRLHPRRHPGGRPVGHDGRLGRRRSDRRALPRSGSRTSRCARARARGRAASRPLDRSTRGGRALGFRCASGAQLRARWRGSDVELGLCTRSGRARRRPTGEQWCVSQIVSVWFDRIPP